MDLWLGWWSIPAWSWLWTTMVSSMPMGVCRG
jgi:hypothetical protein